MIIIELIGLYVASPISASALDWTNQHKFTRTISTVAFTQYIGI